MALTRKLLTALGIEADKIDQIIEAHIETIEGLKGDRDSYKEKAEKLDSVQNELDELKKKNTADSGYKEKYEKEHQAFEDYKRGIDEEKSKQAKKDAYKELLKKAGVSEKRVEAILKVTDLGAIEMDDKGAIKKADEIEKNIKTEWADFIETKKKTGAEVNNPPANNGGSGDGNELSKLAAQMQANLYGAPKTE